MKKFKIAVLTLGLIGMALLNVLFMNFTFPDQTAATIEALRLDAMITGGATPYNDSAGVFNGMVNAINKVAPDYATAAQLATNSSLFQYYLPRRMAKEMMTPQMSEAGIPDNAATTLILANFIGAGGTRPSLKNIWSQNATYCFNLPAANYAYESQAAGAPGCPSGSFYPYFLRSDNYYTIDWRTALVSGTGQMAETANNATLAIQPKDVAGFMTLIDNQKDQQLGSASGAFVNFAFTGGTNIRAIEGLYQIAMGVSLPQLESTANVTASMAPPFVPSDNPNFLVGQNQAACIACHGGGVSNLTHGYATVGDLFDWVDNQGFVYNPNPIYKPNGNANDSAQGLGKSFGSNPDTRVAVYNCLGNPNAQASGTVCNPSSAGVGTSQAWNLTSWQQSGLLTTMGWTGPITGNGFNSLAAAVAQAGLTYQFMVQRVINEICPLGTFSSSQISAIAAQAQTIDNSTGTQPVGPYAYIVTQVATDQSCL